MEQEVVLDVKVKNQGLKQQLREAVKEAQALQERFGATSTEAINAAKKVANIKEEISDMNDVFKAFNPEQKFNAVIGVTQGIAGGFQSVTGAMQLFGNETKDVEKALLKVQAATAFAEGLNNIRGLGDSFKNLKLMVMDGIRSLGTLRGALIATGVGVFAVAVGAIVTNWKELKGWIDKTFPSLAGIGDMFDKIKKVAFGTLSSIVEGFKIVGEVIGNVFTGEFSKAVDIAGTFGQRVSQAYTKGYVEEEKKLADERAAALLETQNKEHARTLKVLEAQGKDTYAFKRKLLNDELELLRLQGKKETDDYKDKLTEIRVLDAEHKKMLADKEAQDLEERKKKNQAWLDEAKVINENLQYQISQRGIISKEEREKEIAASLEAGKRQAERALIDIQYEEELSKRKIEIKQKERDAALLIAQETVNGLSAIGNAFIKDSKKLEKFNKAMALVQIAIDTAKAISSLTAAANANPLNGPTGGIAGIAQYATGIAQILANVAKAKALLSQSSSGGGGNVSLGGAGGGASTSATMVGGGVMGMQAPQQVGQGIANANAINNALNNPNMIRAVVVETDITDSQNRVRGIEDRATFG